MNARTIIGRRPQVSRGDTHIQIDTALSGNFRVIHNEPSYSDAVSIEFQDNTAYINRLVVNAPPVKESSKVIELGPFHRYKGDGHNKWNRPKANRRIASEEIFIFRFRNVTKGFYYPKHQTLVLARMGYDYRSFNNLDLIMRWLRESDNGITLNALPGDSQVSSQQRIKLLIGADPEFEVLGGNLCPMIPDRTEFGDYLSTPIGIDGAGSQLEFRPKAGTVEQVVDRLTDLMKKVKHRICTIGNRYAVGGHIHLGYGFNYNPHPDLLWLLDEYLGKPTIELSGCARGGYKCLSSAETKPHGFEYRSCPAAIFDHPELARLSMTIAKNVCERYSNGGMFTVRSYGVGMDEYVNFGILSGEDYERWVYMLTHYPENPYDCRINWAPDSELAEPLEILMSSAQIARIRESEQARIRDQEAEERRYTAEIEADREANMERARLRAQHEAALLEAQNVNTMGLSFADDWVPQTIIDFRDGIRAVTQDAVCLFGLTSTRGAVTYGYQAPDCIRLADAESSSWHGRYGVPWDVRMGHNNDAIPAHIQGILEVQQAGGNPIPPEVANANTMVQSVLNRSNDPASLPIPEDIPLGEAEDLASPRGYDPMLTLNIRREMFNAFVNDVRRGMMPPDATDLVADSVDELITLPLAVEMLRIRRRQLGLRAWSNEDYCGVLVMGTPPQSIRPGGQQET